MRAVLICSTLLVCSLAHGQTVRLQLKFPKGRVDRTAMSMSMTDTMTMPGSTQPMKMQMTQSTAFLMRVVSAGASGAGIRITYERSKSSTLMNGKPITVPGADSEALLKGQSYMMYFSPTGKIQKIDGLQQLLDKSLKSSPPQMQQMYKQMF